MEMSSMDDSSYSNLNSVNISMAPSKEFVDNNESFEDRLKQLQSERNVTINIEQHSDREFQKQMDLKNNSVSNQDNANEIRNQELMIEPRRELNMYNNSNEAPRYNNSNEAPRYNNSNEAPRYNNSNEAPRYNNSNEAPRYNNSSETSINNNSNEQNLEYLKLINNLQTKVRDLEEENSKLNKSTSYVEELIKNINNLKRENESLKDRTNMNNLNNSILNQRESTLIDREAEVNKLLDIYHQINNKKYIQLDIFSNNESEYIYEFDNISGIIGIKLMSYSLPKPRFNITEKNNSFKYSINDVDKEIKLEIGFYTITELIEQLNNNEDFEIVNKNHKLLITSKEDIDLETSFLIVNNLGFEKNTYGKEIKASKSWDLRLPDKLFLYIKNINESIPIGILYFNEIFSSEVLLEEPIDLDNFEIKLTDEDGEAYDFTNLYHSLSFKLEVVINENLGSEIDSST